MPSSLIAAIALQIGPFYEQKEDYAALRPFVAREEETVDVLWPVFTSHRDWWRFCFLAWYEKNAAKDEYQFTLLPVWCNGRAEEYGAYWNLFPLYGRHPHIAAMYDVRFALWPLWTRYSIPRGRNMLVTDSVLFPFFSFRSDGSWGAWPLCGVNKQRESVHKYALWPLFTWAEYRKDRDTSGEGWSWMFWPVWGEVRRERETQHMFLPPFFSWTETFPPAAARLGRSAPDFRLRCPWPFFEWEDGVRRSRVSVWPLYENSVLRGYSGEGGSSSATRFGWRLLEFYRRGDGSLEEWRLFPFVVSREDYTRVWPFWESATDKDGTERSRFLAIFPIRWSPAVDRNWAKFWTFWETEESPVYKDHSLFWGIIRWRTWK